MLHLFIRPAGRYGVPDSLRCNICEKTVDATDAKDHAMTKDHASKKSRLEEELKSTVVRKYAEDSTVVLRWSASV